LFGGRREPAAAGRPRFKIDPAEFRNLPDFLYGYRIKIITYLLALAVPEEYFLTGPRF